MTHTAPRPSVAWHLALSLALLLGLAALTLPSRLFGQDATTLDLAQVEQLSDVLKLPETVELLRDEGLQQGEAMANDYFGGADPAWSRSIARIHDASAMERQLEAALGIALAGQEGLVPEMIAFFQTDLGQQIITLELEARRATIDPAALEAARAMREELVARDAGRAALIERLVVAADLLEGNVMAAMNSNLAFLQGMGDSGAPGVPQAESDLLAEVWSQETEVRQSVADFLYPVMTLAYSALSGDELETYADFYESPAGRVMNTALTSAFGELFVDLSGQIGREAGLFLAGQAL